MAAAREKLIIGWDIGGVRSKCAAVTDGALPVAERSESFEIWKGPHELDCVLRRLGAGLNLSGAVMGVTMTAELSDCFPSKREGVRFVLESFGRTFSENSTWCLSVDGEWVSLVSAMESPDDFAATNWVAAAQEAARCLGDGIWVDVGSTTTDIIPFRDGTPCPLGKNDTDRLRLGELVYTGVVRSNPNTVARRVPFRGDWCPVADEYFSVMGDCYLILGKIETEDYAVTPPDRGLATAAGASRRLARLICADGNMVSEDDLLLLSGYLRERQTQMVSEALCQVCSREIVQPAIFATGIGKFLAEAAAARLGLPIIEAGQLVPEGFRKQFPAYAAARGLFLSKGSGL